MAIETKKFVFIPSQDVPAFHMPLLEAVCKVLKKVKEGKTGAEDRAQEKQRLDLVSSTSRENSVKALWDYEKAHLQAGENWDAVVQRLKRETTAAGEVLVSNYYDYGNERGTAMVEGKVKGQIKRLGTVFLGDARFTDLRPQPEGLKNKVFVLGRFAHQPGGAKLEQDPNHAKSHFVKLTWKDPVKKDEKVQTTNQYVRRFVTRGLNHMDLIYIAAGIPLGAVVRPTVPQEQLLTPERAVQATGPTVCVGGTATAMTKDNFKPFGRNPNPGVASPNNAITRETTTYQMKGTDGIKRACTNLHPVSAGTALDERQQILSHTRGWQKRYISTGVSKRPVFSTRGTQFMSIFGTALVDLAQVDLSTVFDVHNTSAVGKVLGWDANRVTSETDYKLSAEGLDNEKYLALRDVLRTRELLIKHQVPQAAVKSNADGGKRLVGLGGKENKNTEELRKDLESKGLLANVVGTDTTNYPGYANKYWLFLLFDTESNANAFCDTYKSPPVEVLRIRLTPYKMPDTLPGWK